jgi:hypothetical protein
MHAELVYQLSAAMRGLDKQYRPSDVEYEINERQRPS